MLNKFRRLLRFNGIPTFGPSITSTVLHPCNSCAYICKVINKCVQKPILLSVLVSLQTLLEIAHQGRATISTFSDRSDFHIEDIPSRHAHDARAGSCCIPIYYNWNNSCALQRCAHRRVSSLHLNVRAFLYRFLYYVQQSSNRIPSLPCQAEQHIQRTQTEEELLQSRRD